MRTFYISVLTLLLHFAPYSLATDINLDIWFVRDLISDLSQDSFAVREQATQRLIAIGPIVLPEIAKAAEGVRLDLETRERLERIAREAEFSHLNSVSLAVAEYERLAAELAHRKPTGAEFVLLRLRADRVLERIDTLARPDERDRTLGRMLSGTGAQFFLSPFCERRSATLRFAIDDLQLAMSCFDRILARNPKDSATSDAQRRTATLLGSALWMESPRFE